MAKSSRRVRPETAEAVALAKAWLIPQYDGDRLDLNRSWLVAEIPPSYEKERYGGTLLVREGSPPKGYILDTCTGAFALLPAAGKLKRFYAHHVCETEYRREHEDARSFGFL
jgi:hypothetical protein